VDEFQDVDAAQLRLVQLLAAPEGNLLVVGDDDQTIYAWRRIPEGPVPVVLQDDPGSPP
jgi:superfamily I DNA/RNA helicase